ncbi:MAG: hypothetical protein IJ213_09875 [Bacteroidales bacterium]|nr:hypothetical protein [Bacteroidales bacterium]
MNKIKTYITLLLAIFVGVSVFTSCSDEEDVLNHQNKRNKMAYSDISTYSYVNYDGEKVSMLYFKTAEDFIETLGLLASNYDSFNDSINNVFCQEHGKDSSAVDEMPEDFNIHSVFSNFEKNFNYIPLRPIYEKAENAYVQSQDETDENDPFYTYPYTIEEMSLLNKYGEVRIGDEIVKYVKDDYVVFPLEHIIDLVSFNSGDTFSILSNDYIKSSLPSNKCGNTNSECLTRKSETYFLYPKGDKTYKTRCHISFSNTYLYVRTHARTTAYRYSTTKKKYVHSRVMQRLRINDVYLRDADCTTIATILSGKQRTKGAYEISLTVSSLELVKHYRISRSHDYQSIIVTYKHYPTKIKYDIMFWGHTPIPVPF